MLSSSKVDKCRYHELNRDTRITVRTPLGDSDQRETGENWGQGTVEGAIVSSKNLDGGVNDFFEASDYEFFFHSLRLQPILFQDDLLRVCQDPVSAQYGTDCLQTLAETKLLDYNLSKCCVIIMGSKSNILSLEDSFEKHPPLLCGKPIKIEHVATYLGDRLSVNLTQSVTLTLNQRIGLAKRAIMEICLILEDCRSEVMGSIKTGILLYETCLIPFLLSNSSTWLKISKKDEDRLIKLQNLFLNKLLGVFKCPAVLMHFDLAMIIMPLRILKSKLLLYHHILTLPSESLALKILKTQQRLNIYSLRDEVAPFLAKHEVSDVNTYSKEKWKLFVKRNISLDNRNYLLEQAKRFKKLDPLELSCEEYRMKDYFSNLNLADARLKFRIRSKCVNTCRTMYPSDENNIKAQFQCYFCPKLDILSHWRSCPKFQHLRKNRSLSEEKDILDYYREIIQTRMEELK